MTIHGYELLSDWKNIDLFKIAIAKKGEKKYFLKRYRFPSAPVANQTQNAESFAHHKEKFEAFVAQRKRANNFIRQLAGERGYIINAREEFIIDNQYVEVFEFFEGVLTNSEIIYMIPNVSQNFKKIIMKTLAAALSNLHSNGVIHSNLTLENILIARNQWGFYDAKILNFDNSYLINDKPEEITGTIDYYSPEMGAYTVAEDEREELKKHITEKSDIFSLGLIYHFYLSGEFPEAVSWTEKLQKLKDDGKAIFPWVILNSGCELRISPKIKKTKYISLISDMLSLDPANRPTASEILKRLDMIDSDK